MNTRTLAECLLLFLVVSRAAAATVEGPFRPTTPAADPTKDGIWLTYQVSSRTSTNWIDCAQADGSRISAINGLAELRQLLFIDDNLQEGADRANSKPF